MLKMLGPWVAVLLLGVVLVSPASGGEQAARFEGGIGVNPVSSVVGSDPTGGAVRNVVRGVAPGGQPWTIEDLSAQIAIGGRVTVQGRRLLLAGGNAIGTAGGQSVNATLICGPLPSGPFTVHSSGFVPLASNGDFTIDDVLSPAPPNPCENAVLLIVNTGGRWFAAGVPRD